ncbi:cell surface glycoprotein [Streptomyces sp. NPDC056210]|uniref:zinc finger domain-containing protein n=1 Tax=Streptomyces TaxID=1883 RepID=UPI0035DFDB48
MTPDQIPDLLKRVSYADPRVLPEDPQEVLGMAALWADVLRDVPTDFAMQAVGAHYAVSPFPIKPSDISTRWHAVVRDRMDRHNGTFEPTQHPELDPDDVPGFQRALLAERHAVIHGQAEPNTVKAITAGPAAAEVQARLDAMGTYMPASVKETLAALRPDAVERERLIRSGLSDPRSVACPWDACHAPRGQRCRTNGRDRRDYHPARVDAAQNASQAVA